jgi:sugar phosphate isomerase/epimerase
MKLSLSTLSCPGWNLQQIVESARAVGLEGIDFRGLGEEIDITRLAAFNEQRAETLGLLRRSGLSMPCLNLSVTLVSPAPERWHAMLEECSRAASLSKDSGTAFLRIFGGGAPKELSRDEARAMAERRLRQLVKICRGCGTQVLVETHDDWATSAQMLELIHQFDPDEVGVLWDIEHPWRAGESPVDTATALRRFIRHVHIKDSVRSGGKNHPTLIGQGELPVLECIHVLREINYQGWCCLETEKRWHADAPEPEQSVPQFADFMRRL